MTQLFGDTTVGKEVDELMSPSAATTETISRALKTTVTRKSRTRVQVICGSDLRNERVHEQADDDEGLRVGVNQQRTENLIAARQKSVDLFVMTPGFSQLVLKKRRLADFGVVVDD